MISKENIQTAISNTLSVIGIDKGGKFNRAKAFALCFEQLETKYGKAELTEGVKDAVKKQLDNEVKILCHFSKSEVVKAQSSYARINSDGSFEHGRKQTLQNLEQLPLEVEIVRTSMLLKEHRAKVAKKEDGASEGDIRKERQLRNAINSRLWDAMQAKLENDEVKNIRDFMQKLPELKREEMVLA